MKEETIQGKIQKLNGKREYSVDEDTFVCDNLYQLLNIESLNGKKKILVRHTLNKDLSFPFSYLRESLVEAESIHFLEEGGIFSSEDGKMIFCVSENGYLILLFYLGGNGHVDIPDGVNIIGHHAFCSTRIRSVSLPESVVSIRNNAFDSCVELESVVLPESLQEIQKFAFFRCRSLKSIETKGNCKKIGWSAFESCKNLQSVVLHEGIEEIETEAFQNCQNLKYITLPMSLEKLGSASLSEVQTVRVSKLIPSLALAVDRSMFYGASDQFCCIEYKGCRILLPRAMDGKGIEKAQRKLRAIKDNDSNIYYLYSLAPNEEMEAKTALAMFCSFPERKTGLFVRRHLDELKDSIAEEESGMLKILKAFKDLRLLSAEVLKKSLDITSEKEWACAKSFVLQELSDAPRKKNSLSL